MCINPVDIINPKTHLDFNLEASGFKPGRFNPVPGPMGHGAPFQQFSGTYQGNDLMNKTGISPSAQSTDYTPYIPAPTELTAAAKAKLASLNPYGANQQATGMQATTPGQASGQTSSQETDPSVASMFATNNVKVAK